MSIFSEIASKIINTRDKIPGSDLKPIQDVLDQDPDERKLYEHVKSKIDLVRQTNSRIATEGVYLTNVAYLMGFDGVYYDTTYRQFKNIDPRRRVTRNRFKVNKILPTVQNRLSRLTQSPPRYDVRPNSNSTEDKDACRLGLQVIEDVFDKNSFDAKRQDLIMALMQGGHSYGQVLWDPSLGEPMYDPETEEFMGYEGDVRIEVLNCLEVFPDPLAKNLEEAQWIIKAKVRKLEYFKDTYQDRGDAVKEESAWLLSSIYDLKSNALTSVGIVGAQTQDQMKDSAIELVYYEKRSKDYPNGRMVVCANGVLLEDKELPIGIFDIVKFDDMIIGGRYNPEAIITHLRPVQDQYNVTRSKIADWVKKLLAGKYIVAKGANLQQEALNDDNGEVMEYTPVPNASEPKAMDIPQIPPYAYKDLQTLDGEFDFISGINEVSRGVLPSASIPASGLAFLQEQDQTRIGVTTSRLELGYARLGQCILRYVGRYYEIPRLLKEAGDGLEYTVKEFKGGDLHSNYDVIVIPGSTVPTSKVLRRQDILNAYQMGILGNPQDDKVKMQILEMLEYGDEAKMWKTQALTKARIKKEIALIEDGEMPPLSEFDNHQMHLLELNDYRLSDKYDNLDKDKQGLLVWVIEWHLNALNNLQNPGLAQQKMAAQIAINHLPQIAQQQQQALSLHPGAPQNQPQNNGIAPPQQQQQPAAPMPGGI